MFPQEIWEFILYNLTELDIVSVSFINKFLNTIISNNNFWLSFDDKYFGDIKIYSEIRKSWNVLKKINNAFHFDKFRNSNKYNNVLLCSNKNDNTISCETDEIFKKISLMIELKQIYFKNCEFHDNCCINIY